MTSGLAFGTDGTEVSPSTTLLGKHPAELRRCDNIETYRHLEFPLKSTDSASIVDEALLDSITSSLRECRKVNRKLGTKGHLYIERQLPYLCVYRKIETDKDWGTNQLVTGEASYLTVSGSKQDLEDATVLVESIAKELTRLFGTFLVIEIWSGGEIEHTNDQPVGKPGFRAFIPKHQPPVQYLHTLAKHLSLVSIRGQYSRVAMKASRSVSPPDMKPVLSPRVVKQLGAHALGMEISPIYRDAKTGEHFPAVLSELQAAFTTVLERTFFTFLKHETTICPPNYLALGQRSMVQSVWQVDRMLSEIATHIDFLLLVTPTNSGQAQEEFRRSFHNKAPVFLYHPAPFSAIELKRKLYKTPIERIEDPTLAHMFREQLEDLDSRISMVQERGTKSFLYSSLKLYDRPDKKLVDLARKILKNCPDEGFEGSTRRLLTPQEFAAMATEELTYYRSKCPDLGGTVQIRDDVPGVMVSNGNLLIGTERRVSKRRAYALLSHEIGTHILTNYNGKAQQFRQLSAGLPGYDELQESLAVLGEYLVGGLTGSRLRTLAARVMAVHWLCEGATFVDVYRNLTLDWGFSGPVAFTIALRVFRSGGFTKDVVYLRGLTKLIEQVKNGLQLDLLFTGKFGLDYLPIVRELMYRKILEPAKLKPRYFEEPEFHERMARIRKGISILDMVSE